MSVKHLPPQRNVHAMIYTPAGWISGDFVLSKLHGLLAFLNASSGFVKLVNARFYRSAQKVSFLAIQRDAMTIIVPSETESVAANGRALTRTTTEPVSCIFDRGMVHGILEVIDQTRVSDFLMQKLNYFPLIDATLAFGSLSEASPRVVPVAIVNAHQLLAITHPRIDKPAKAAMPAGREGWDAQTVAM